MRLGYRKSYYFTHPHKLISELCSHVKWAWQRVVRGWDDTVTWDLDRYLCFMMPQWLDRLASVPYLGCPKRLEVEGLSSEENAQRWKDMIHQMADGFRAGANCADTPIYREAVQEYEKRYGEPPPCSVEAPERVARWDALCAELRVKERDKAWQEEQLARFKAGWELMGEHFFSLWD